MDYGEEVKRSWDLTAIVILTLLLALIIYVIPDTLLRTVLGLPFILFFPGYSFITMLFPERKSLDLIERIALSFGLSIALVPLIGFGLNYTPFGIRLEPILWSLIVFNIAVSALAMWRRSSSADPFLPIKLQNIKSTVVRGLGGGSRVDRILTVILVLAIASSVIALVYVVAFPKEGEQFSEFYVLGPGGQASGYPSNLTVNQSGSVILGIANHEQRTVNYTVEVWLVNSTFANNVTTVNSLIFYDSFNVTLDSVPVDTLSNWTKQWETNYTFSISETGQYKLWFILLKDGTPFPGVKNENYAGTSEEQAFLSMIQNNSYQTLNLNLKVR